MRFFFAITTAVLLSIVSANAQYKMKVTLKNGQETEYKVSEIENVTWLEETVTPGDSDGIHNGHEYVDLGLPSGTKWATCNVGANSPEEYGGYYAWGETSEKSVYNDVSYKYYVGTDTDGDGFFAENYNIIDIGSEISGTRYDVARVRWGGDWCMPTATQCKELCEYCLMSWTSVNDVWGAKVVGPNGNSIFLPAASCRWKDFLLGAGLDGFYWSGTLDDDHIYCAYYMRVDGSPYMSSDINRRCYGQSVRPVCP